MAASLLIIAGSDSGGGAGIQADLKAASALGVYTATAITAITAQNTVGVQAVEVLAPGLVTAQIASVLSDIDIHAVKIGMLGDAAVVEAVRDALDAFRGPVVLDPVMIAKSGDALLSEAAAAALCRDLLPRATLLTPNLPEAARLLNCGLAATEDEVADQGRALSRMTGGAILMKGGHGRGPICIDHLVTPETERRFEAPRKATRNTHGTGCSYASAIAAGLARGDPLEQAVERAHGWLQGAIAGADRLDVGHGHGPVHHFHETWS